MPSVAGWWMSTRALGSAMRLPGVPAASSTAAAIYWHYGAIAYDVESGKSGKSANRLYRADAVAKALAECGTPNCWAYGFQTGNGAIAKSADGSLFSGWSGGGGLFSSAARDAKKRCKQASGDRNCEVVIEGAALDTDIAIRDSEATLQRAKALIDGGR